MIVCNGPVPVKRLKRAKGVAKYCGSACESEHHRRLYAHQNRSAFAGIATGTVGTINELRVSVDLLAKGHHVFRALSPACSCDLIILVGRQAYRVEVTTGCWSRVGKLQYRKHELVRFDLLAVVLPEHIFYFTEIADLQSLVSGEGMP